MSLAVRLALYYYFSLQLLVHTLEIVTYATDPEHMGLAMLQDTARWHGWQAVHVVGTEEGFRTHGLVDKLRALRMFARKWPDDTVLVFVDAYDVVINNEPFVLESAFLASGKRVLLASEVGCCTDKESALRMGTNCHRNWPFAALGEPRTNTARETTEEHHRIWLNSGVIVGYAQDIRRLLRLAWREYKTNPPLYKAFTDQQLLCFLVSDGSTVWSRAAVGIDHGSEVALTTYRTDIQSVLGVDPMGRMVFSNRTVPPIIHFNGPAREKASQMEYARANFPLLSRK